MHKSLRTPPYFPAEHPNLLAMGCYDGSVMVYDVHLKQSTPIYQSSVRSGKHSDPVWNVFWQVCTGHVLVGLHLACFGKCALAKHCQPVWG
eukprot:1152064-Pelagomonas_calceolata.AAC.1